MRVIFTAVSTRSRMMDSTSRPTYPTSVNLVASILMNGAWPDAARRRAISVLRTPVGPISRMFFGVISSRRSALTWLRRQRLRRAIATERLASAWPIMCLSSFADDFSRGHFSLMNSLLWLGVQFFDTEIVVGVNTNIGGDGQRPFHNLAGAQFGIFQQGAGGRLCAKAPPEPIAMKSYSGSITSPVRR